MKQDIKYKNWDIWWDRDFALYIATHESYDPTPINPDDSFSDQGKIIVGVTEDSCKREIDKLIVDN